MCWCPKASRNHAASSSWSWAGSRAYCARRPSSSQRSAATAYRLRAVSASSTACPDDSTQTLSPHAEPPLGAPSRYPTTRLPSTATEPDASGIAYAAATSSRATAGSSYLADSSASASRCRRCRAANSSPAPATCSSLNGRISARLT